MKKIITKFSLPIALVIGAVILILFTVLPAQSRPPLGATNFDAIHLRSAEATTVPLLRVRNNGNSRSLEIQDTGGTPEVVINANGAMTINNLTLSTVTAPVIGYPTPGIICNRNTQTITDTATYTSTVVAVTTPSSVMCSMNAITGDAANCRAVVGTPGSVIVSVVNTALTPAANAVGAAVTFETCGTK